MVSSVDQWRGPRRRQPSLTGAAYRLLSGSKDVYHRGRYRRADGSRPVLFILGCQRSGTTLLNELFQHDPRTKVYGEVSVLTNQDQGRRLRLNPWPEVRDAVAGDRAPLVVIKPLVESQNGPELLSFFDNARAVWMLRHYRPVADSIITKWGRANPVGDLTELLAGHNNNWRAEHVSGHTRDTVAANFHPEISGHDAAALFWYARNRLLLERGPAMGDRLKVCRYSDLIADSRGMLRSIYNFVDQPYPGDWVGFRVHNKSIGSRPDIELDPAIEQLCAELWQQLAEQQR